MELRIYTFLLCEAVSIIRFYFQGSGTSDLPCSDIYCGAEPFSEIETQNVRDQLAAIVPRIYLSYHSYSQMILYPWGYALEYPDNVDDLVSLATNSFLRISVCHHR